MIKRYYDYSPDMGIQEDDDGDYVLYIDHLAALSAKDVDIAALRQTIEAWQREVLGRDSDITALQSELAALRADAERMRAAILALKQYEESNPPNGYTEWDKYYDALFDAAMQGREST